MAASVPRAGNLPTMRVIGGVYRGRRLHAPPGDDVRPTSDRVKEAIFNTLFSMGLPADALVVDAFAGSGSLGLEALSRGAAAVTFIERSPAAIAAIEQNLASLDAEATVLRADALHAIERVPREVALVLADPPYEFDDWSTFLDRCPPATVVIESDRPIEPRHGAGWEQRKSKRHGRAHVSILVPEEPASTQR